MTLIETYQEPDLWVGSFLGYLPLYSQCNSEKINSLVIVFLEATYAFSAGHRLLRTVNYKPNYYDTFGSVYV